MKLHSPHFEKALRRGVKAAIRSSRELKREFRRVKRQQPRQYSIVKLARPLLSILIAASAWFVADRTGHVASALAVITITSFLFACYRARNLLDDLHDRGQNEAVRQTWGQRLAVFAFALAVVAAIVGASFAAGSAWSDARGKGASPASRSTPP